MRVKLSRSAFFRVVSQLILAYFFSDAAHMQSTDPSSLGLDEERKTRRRGSQL